MLGLNRVVKRAGDDDYERAYLVETCLGAVSRADEVFNLRRYHMQGADIQTELYHGRVIWSQAWRQPQAHTGAVNYA